MFNSYVKLPEGVYIYVYMNYMILHNKHLGRLFFLAHDDVDFTLCCIRVWLVVPRSGGTHGSDEQALLPCHQEPRSESCRRLRLARLTTPFFRALLKKSAAVRMVSSRP